MSALRATDSPEMRKHRSQGERMYAELYYDGVKNLATYGPNAFKNIFRNFFCSQLSDWRQ